MDEDALRELARGQSNLFSTADARGFGYDDRAITSMVRRRLWVRVRRGYFVPADIWAVADEVERYLWVARAVVRSSKHPLAVSHVTGSLALKVSAWQPRLNTVHVARLDGRHGRTEHGVTHHERKFSIDDCLRVDDDFLVPPIPYTIFGAMSQHDVDKAVTIGDSALNMGMLTDEELWKEAQDSSFTPYTRGARFAVRLLDGGAASPGESLARMLFWRQGLPRPTLQHPITLPGQVAFLDFMWEDAGVGGEFDGKQKYMRSAQAGEDPGEVVFREKRREDALLEEGTVRIMRRMIWADLSRPQQTAARFRDAIARGSRRQAVLA